MSGATLTEISTGLAELLTAAGCPVVLQYEPTSIPKHQTAFSSRNTANCELSAGRVPMAHWSVEWTVALLWQDNASADATIRAMEDAILAQVEGNRSLGGRLRHGRVDNVRFSGGEEFINVSDARYVVVNTIFELWDM